MLFPSIKQTLNFSFSRNISFTQSTKNTRLLLIQTVTLIKSVNTSACVYKLLFTCKERVTFGTNFNTDILLCRAGFDNITASTGNGSLLVLRMSVLLHIYNSPLSIYRSNIRIIPPFSKKIKCFSKIILKILKKALYIYSKSKSLSKMFKSNFRRCAPIKILGQGRAVGKPLRAHRTPTFNVR